MRNDRHDEPLSDEELELFLQYLQQLRAVVGISCSLAAADR
ncbi:hypothetical protein ACH40F_16410 [Streptomyces sp. NPDC020794]